MARLVALDLALGPALEAALRSCAERGDAVCVLDGRLSARARDRELAALAPTHLVDGDGERALEGGRGVDDDVGAVVRTSGSGGDPKAAELSWSALEASARMTSDALDRGQPATWFPCLPASHVGGLAVLLRSVLAGADLVWGDPADPAAGPGLGATHVAVVRTQLARADLSAYDVVLLGGGRMPAGRPANTVATWGMTETGSGVVYDGRALPGVDVAAVDGELLVRSPTLFSRYRDAERPRASGPDGRADWFPTGDGGAVVNGNVTVFGRLDTVIGTGGEKVWPEDLEVVLAAVPGVRDVAVTGAPDAEWGERVVCLVVGDRDDLDGALRAAAEDAIGPWAKPKEVRVVAAIPRTATGKVARARLADLH